jgi:transposase
VPVLAKGKTMKGRIWVYVRDDQPFAGRAPPGAVFYYSRDRAGDLAENARRKAEGKKPAPISPLAPEAVRRIDARFEIERAINGQSAEQRKAVRQQLSAPLVADLHAWMREHRAKRSNDVAKAMDYMLKRWIPPGNPGKHSCCRQNRAGSFPKRRRPCGPVRRPYPGMPVQDRGR